MSDTEYTKISAKFFAPLYASFDKQLAKALIKRDAFIDQMISSELHHLAEDLDGKRNSPKARQYIARNLKSLGGKNTPPLRLVSIQVRKATSQRLAELEKQHNFSRDAFLNRLVALYRSSDKLLDALELPKTVQRSGLGLEDMPTSPMRAIEAVQADAFYYLRAACMEIHGCGLHALAMPDELVALSCYIPDTDLPGTLENTEREAIHTELFQILENFESGLTLIKKVKHKQPARSSK